MPKTEAPAEPENITGGAEDAKALESRVGPMVEKLVSEQLAKGEAPAVGEKGPPTDYRVFVAPANREHKVLVKAGEVRMGKTLDEPGARERIGDVWAVFHAGILKTDDPKVIKWCEAHDNVCRDAFAPDTVAWVSLVEAQMEKPNRGAVLSRDLDMGKILAGDMTGMDDSDLVKQARAR